MIGLRTIAPIKATDVELNLHIKPFVAFDLKAEPVSVRGWPLSRVIDGILAALDGEVFRELNPELRDRFDDTFRFHMEEPQAPQPLNAT